MRKKDKKDIVIKAGREKAKAVAAYPREMKLKEAAKKVEDSVEETLTCCDSFYEHWTRIRTSHTLLSGLREWLHFYAEPTLRPATFTNYELIIERHFNTKLGKVQLKNVPSRMPQDFFNEKLISGRADKKSGGLSAKTLKT